MKERIKKLWEKITGKKNVFPQAKHVITEAFMFEGVQFYQFDSIFNLPYQRGLAAIMVYEELRMKCDYELLKAFVDANDKVYSGSRLGVKEFMELKRMNDIVKERLNWVLDTDLVYKLASVVYFDANESPYHYDSKYAFEKVQRWKKSEDINAFFLREPIQNLIPFLKGVQLNFQEYSEAQNPLTEKHRTTFSSKLSETSGNNSKSKPSSSSVQEMPRKSD